MKRAVTNNFEKSQVVAIFTVSKAVISISELGFEGLPRCHFATDK